MKTLPINAIKQEYVSLSPKQKAALLLSECARQTANSLMHDFMNNIPEPKDELGQYVKELVKNYKFLKEHYNTIHKNVKLNMHNTMWNK